MGIAGRTTLAIAIRTTLSTLSTLATLVAVASAATPTATALAPLAVLTVAIARAAFGSLAVVGSVIGSFTVA